MKPPGQRPPAPPLRKKAPLRGLPRSLTSCQNKGTRSETRPSVTDIPDRRADLTDRMADFVLAHGLAAASLRPLAAAAGISDRMLLYYFKDKPTAIAVTLDALTRRLADLLEASATRRPLPLGRLRNRLVRQSLDQALWPYMCLWLDLAARAARGDTACRATSRGIGLQLAAWIEAQLVTRDPGEAARLLVQIEGAVLGRAIGMRDTTD